MRDLYSNIGAVPALAPAVQNAAVQGIAIDLAGFGRACIVVTTGAVAGAGDFGVKLQEADTATPGDFADVPAGAVDSNAPATLAADQAYKLGYRGTKRYVRLAMTKAGGTSIVAGAVAVKADAASRPVT